MKVIFPLFIFLPFGIYSQTFEFNSKQNSAAHKGIEYIHLNPASIPFDKFLIKIAGIKKFNLDEFFLSSLDFSFRSSQQGAFAFGVSNFNQSFYQNSIFRILYNRGLTEDLNLGGGLFLDLKSNIYASSGLIYKIKELNTTIGTSVFFQENNLKIHWGLNYHVTPKFSLLASFDKSTDRKWGNEFSFQYQIHDKIQCIGGIQPSKFQWYWCIVYGIMPGLEFIFNYNQHAYLGSSPAFSLIFRN